VTAPITTRPELHALTLDEQVIVIERRGSVVEVGTARVVKIGSAWVTLEAARPRLREWRMHLGTQNEGGGVGPAGARFATAAQYAWEQALAAADTYLREQGVYPTRGPWSEAPRRILLAKLMRKAAQS
jgi:hypothetical protein